MDTIKSIKWRGADRVRRVTAKDIDKNQIRESEREVRTRLASRLEELRQKEGVTLRFLADSAQLVHGQLSQILLGRKNATLNTLVKLAYALDVDIVDLLRKGPIVKPKLRLGRPRTRRAEKSAK
jgi:hypothetical protein